MFTDLNALPAFASLFCSGAASARQSRAWALKLLIDGCVSQHDYQVCSRRFAPGLVMDCVDSAWATQEEKRYCLSTVEAWLRTGGTTAARGLIANAGLLSWLVVVGPRLEGGEKSGSGGRGATLKFLDVAAEAVDKARALEAVMAEDEEGRDGGGL